MQSSKNSPNFINVISMGGPSVEIISPSLEYVCKSPVKIEVLFKTLEGRAVDLSSLKVELVKFIPFDITSMVKSFATQEGIYAEDIELPSGTHKLRLTVRDTAGGRTQIVYEVKIA